MSSFSRGQSESVEPKDQDKSNITTSKWRRNWFLSDLIVALLHCTPQEVSLWQPATSNCRSQSRLRSNGHTGPAQTPGCNVGSSWKPQKCPMLTCVPSVAATHYVLINHLSQQEVEGEGGDEAAKRPRRTTRYFLRTTTRHFHLVLWSVFHRKSDHLRLCSWWPKQGF